MNKKETKSQTNLLVVLVVLLIVFCGYRFGYSNFMNKTEETRKQNEALQKNINELKEKSSNEELYLAATEESREHILDLLSLYGPGITPEKSTMFIIGLEMSAQIQVPSLSFGEANLLYSSSGIPNAEGTPVVATNHLLSFSYKTTYQGLKQSIDYINQYPERMNIQSLTASYDAETGNLSGNILLNQYSVVSISQPYEQPEVGGIMTGKDNIFGTSEIWKD